MINWYDAKCKSRINREFVKVTTNKGGKRFTFYDDMDKTIAPDSFIKFGIDWKKKRVYFASSDSGYTAYKGTYSASFVTKIVDAGMIKDGTYALELDEKEGAWYAEVEFDV